jgi:hypothetical protein
VIVPVTLVLPPGLDTNPNKESTTATDAGHAANANGDNPEAFHQCTIPL